MLRQLHISGLGVIDDLDLEFKPGLNVLTGETGAGKTMITVGLALALGGRASSSLVRRGHRAARVQARFDAPPGSDDWAEDGEVLLARSVSADGRSSARIGGQLATASALGDLGADLVEVQGQRQTQRLLSTTVQTAFLDRYAGDRHLAELGSYREAFDSLSAAQAEMAALSESRRERERELDLLAYQVHEIEVADPAPGETEELAAEESRLAHAERLLELTAIAQGAIAVEGVAADGLSEAAQATRDAADLDPEAAGLASRARALAAETAELARDIRMYGEGLRPDPSRLAEIRDRIAVLKGLQRKYGSSDADVLTFLVDARERMVALAGTDARVGSLEAEVSRLNDELLERARLVTKTREEAAPRLAAAIAGELEELGMPGAVVQVALVPLTDPGRSGLERVEIRLAAGPDQRPLPLSKAASGGELSRSMLACRSVLADLDDLPVLVFDEVDAGIGGKAGLAAGQRLARLSADRQVICVTHLPQIACFADLHARVTKDRGMAQIELLDGAGRVRELSRMLAGLAESDGAITHAEELLAEATRIRAGTPA